jgi:predicted sugar kinase
MEQRLWTGYGFKVKSPEVSCSITKCNYKRKAVKGTTVSYNKMKLRSAAKYKYDNVLKQRNIFKVS